MQKPTCNISSELKCTYFSFRLITELLELLLNTWNFTLWNTSASLEQLNQGNEALSPS